MSFCVIFSFNHLIPLSRVFFVCVHVLSYFYLFLYHNMLSFESLKLTKQLRADVWLAINVLGFVWGFFFFFVLFSFMSANITRFVFCWTNFVLNVFPRWIRHSYGLLFLVVVMQVLHSSCSGIMTLLWVFNVSWSRCQLTFRLHLYVTELRCFLTLYYKHLCAYKYSCSGDPHNIFETIIILLKLIQVHNWHSIFESFGSLGIFFLMFC